MSNEGIKVEGEAEGGSLNPQVVEEKARSLGWKPLEEYEGDKTTWIDAKEFVGRKPLFDKIKSLNDRISQQSKAFETDMQRISAHFAKMQETEFKRALQKLKEDKAVALEEGDIRQYEKINDEIREVEKQHEVAQKAVQPPQPNTQVAQAELQEWRQENQWFDSDQDLRNEAISIGTGYAVNNPNKSHKEVLDYVASKIKQYYPDKFGGKKQTVATPSVESGGITSQSSTTTKKQKGLTVADLSDDEKEVMRTLVKRGALKHLAEKNKVSQEQQYLTDLAKAKGLI